MSEQLHLNIITKSETETETFVFDLVNSCWFIAGCFVMIMIKNNDNDTNNSRIYNIFGFSPGLIVWLYSGLEYFLQLKMLAGLLVSVVSQWRYGEQLE